MPQLRLLYRLSLGRVPRLRVLHIVVHHQAELVRRVVPRVREEHPAAPNAQRVECAFRGRADQTAVRLGAHPALELLHWDHIRALGVDGCPIQPPVHPVTDRALRARSLLDISWVGVVAGHEREVAEADTPQSAHDNGRRGIRASFWAEAHRQVVERLRAHSSRPPELNCTRVGVGMQGDIGLAFREVHSNAHRQRAGLPPSDRPARRERKGALCWQPRT
mmetsp:Transcript_30087/g.70073  ORF Transcript_30087/g.70073 Transcript_30087/m.70073 type:complete len:220 (-) Transcript_30087:928-1587(-)